MEKIIFILSTPPNILYCMKINDLKPRFLRMTILYKRDIWNLHVLKVSKIEKAPMPNDTLTVLVRRANFWKFNRETFVGPPAGDFST